MIRISIIVPVYNVEIYLNKCLTSIICQDIPYKEYEVIIINDGSTDGSLEIAQQFGEKYSNVKILSQVNKGLSATRNRGFQEAQGKYVWCIDSDDWIEPNCLNRLIELCESNNVDILSIDWFKVNNKVAHLLKTKTKYVREVINGKEGFIEDKYQNPAQLYIYKKEFLSKNNLSFSPGIFHEDMEFTPKAIYLANRLMFSGESVYYYLQREGSIVNKINPKNCYDLLTISELLLDFMVKAIEKDQERIIMYRKAFVSLKISAVMAKKLARNKETTEIFKIINEKKTIVKKVMSDPNFVYRLEAIIFNFFPSLYIFLYGLIKLFKNNLNNV